MILDSGLASPTAFSCEEAVQGGSALEDLTVSSRTTGLFRSSGFWDDLFNFTLLILPLILIVACTNKGQSTHEPK